MNLSKEEMHRMAENAKEAAIQTAFKIPCVRIDRRAYLERTFAAVVAPDVVEKILNSTPSKAGISQSMLDKLARESIKYETYRVSLLSLGCGTLGLPGLVPDLAQYYAYCFRIIQKLAYLYGYPEIISEDSISDAEKNQILIFLGIMFGVSEASQFAAKFTENFAQKLIKDIGKQALTKTAWYPLLKEVLKQIGVKMTKKILEGFVSKTMPFVGGGLSGILTYKGFSAGAKRMHKFFKGNPIVS